jgi:hypothetical protein
MKTAVGFIFTESPIIDLTRRGFLFHRHEETLERGYKYFLCPLNGPQGESFAFELREVLDEEAYMASRASEDDKNFLPFIYEAPVQVPCMHLPNSVSRIKDTLKRDDIEPKDLRDFLQYRKFGSLVVLWMACRDLTSFSEMAQPDRSFTWDNHMAKLISMGPNCFDLLVTEEKGE